jgi:hypothetical protein
LQKCNRKHTHLSSEEQEPMFLPGPVTLFPLDHVVAAFTLS